MKYEPEPGSSSFLYPLHSAVREIAWALQEQEGEQHDLALTSVRRALALVRYHRESLPDQGTPADDYPDRYEDLFLLSIAGQQLLRMLAGPGLINAFGLQDTEAKLRTWLKRRDAEREQK